MLSGEEPGKMSGLMGFLRVCSKSALSLRVAEELGGKGLGGREWGDRTLEDSGNQVQTREREREKEPGLPAHWPFHA